MRPARAFLLTVIFLTAFSYNSAFSEITVDPIGFTVSMEGGEEVEVEMVLSNSGDVDVAFKIKNELIIPDENRRGGPRRDDLGDEVASLNSPGGGLGTRSPGATI